MNRRASVRSAWIVIVTILLAACSAKKEDPQKQQSVEISDGHVDSITVYCDNAFQYLIDQEIRIYEKELPDKHIHVIYLPEAEVMKRLEQDSFSFVIIGRRLREQERDELYKRNRLQVEEHTFATDAIAVVANNSFEQDTIDYKTVLSLLNNTTHEYKLVFEGNGSGVISYMFAQIAHTSVHPSAYAAKSLDELAEYLQKDNKTIGFIPFSRISDENDTTARHLLKKVKVLYIAKTDSTGKMGYATASQSEIADGSYPLDRPVNFIAHSMDEKVGTGFVNYLYREQSGRIILKSGLVPSIMPQRVINVNTTGIK